MYDENKLSDKTLMSTSQDINVHLQFDTFVKLVLK